MRNLYFLALVALMCFGACADDAEIAKIPEKTPVAENSHRVPQTQALQSLAKVLGVIDTPATRGSSNPRTAQKIEAMTRADLFGTATRTGESPRDTLIYLVDFGEGNGSAVLAADDRLEPVIAVYDTFQITEEYLRPAPQPNQSITLDDLYCPEDDDYYLGWSTPPDSDESGRLDNLLLAEYLGAVETIDNGGTIHTKETGWFCTEFIPPMLKTLWHQKSPFNDRTPGNYPAGCVAIAVAQIMAYHEFPRDYCDWELAKDYGVGNRGDDSVHLELAKLSENIGRGCHIKYNFFWSGESFATPAKAKRFLRDIGYTGTSRHVGYDDSLIKDKLRADCPVFIGALTPSSEGHAWVIDGMIAQMNKIDVYCSNNYLKTEYKKLLLLHCNWGWGKSNRNGYFVSNAFNATKGPVQESSYQSETRGNGDRNFTWWFRIVSYNKPRL